MPDLLGGSLSYDVDLSQNGCNCVAALYMVEMPAKNEDGSYREGDDGMYYCDANQVGGAFCPEFDIMEANTFAWRAVHHNCDEPNENGFYGDCDRAGQCHVDVLTDFPDQDHYGPGDNYTINTLNEFNVKIKFIDNDEGEFVQYTIILT